MKWKVFIQGNEERLEELSKLFISDILTIGKEETQFFLKSSDFDLSTTHDEVRAKAERYLIFLNGLSRVFQQSNENFSIFSISDGNFTATQSSVQAVYSIIEKFPLDKNIFQLSLTPCN